jgi:hypothetical protein
MSWSDQAGTQSCPTNFTDCPFTPLIVTFTVTKPMTAPSGFPRWAMERRETTMTVNFLCIYFNLKMVIRPKHVADNLNKIVNNYWNRVALDGNPWTCSSTRNRMQTPKFKSKVCIFILTDLQIFIQMARWKLLNWLCMVFHKCNVYLERRKENRCLAEDSSTVPSVKYNL